MCTSCPGPGSGRSVGCPPTAERGWVAGHQHSGWSLGSHKWGSFLSVSDDAFGVCVGAVRGAGASVPGAPEALADVRCADPVLGTGGWAELSCSPGLSRTPWLLLVDRAALIWKLLVGKLKYGKSRIHCSHSPFLSLISLSFIFSLHASLCGIRGGAAAWVCLCVPSVY